MDPRNVFPKKRPTFIMLMILNIHALGCVLVFYLVTGFDKGVHELESNMSAARVHGHINYHGTIDEAHLDVVTSRMRFLSMQCNTLLLEYNRSQPYLRQEDDVRPDQTDVRPDQTDVRPDQTDIRPDQTDINTNRLYYVYKEKMVYCSIPKTGCSFWKRVLISLNARYNNVSVNPFRLGRNDVHYHLNHLKFNHPENGVYGDSYYRFMFVREPYSRLWSTYVDKFILPDFWYSGAIIKSTLNVKKGYRHKKCQGMDISFEQFLNYVVNNNNNDHWQPMSTLCDPCVFKPDFLGKMGTFMPDVRTLAAMFGFSSLLSYYRGHSEEEIRANIVLMFRLYKNRGLRDCTSMISILRRLWVSFQFNGHISVNARFPVNDLMVIRRLTPRNVLDIFTARSGMYPLDSNEKSSQKKTTVMNAYKSVPLKTKEAIASLYRRDFELFGYDPYPDIIFKTGISS